MDKGPKTKEKVKAKVASVSVCVEGKSGSCLFSVCEIETSKVYGYILCVAALTFYDASSAPGHIK